VGSGNCVEPAMVVTPRVEPDTMLEAVYVTIVPDALVTTTHCVENTVVLVDVIVEVTSSAMTWSEVCINSCTARARKVM
jgi:hypothetical protein